MLCYFNIILHLIHRCLPSSLTSENTLPSSNCPGAEVWSELPFGSQPPLVYTFLQRVLAVQETLKRQASDLSQFESMNLAENIAKFREKDKFGCRETGSWPVAGHHTVHLACDGHSVQLSPGDNHGAKSTWAQRGRGYGWDHRRLCREGV